MPKVRLTTAEKRQVLDITDMVSSYVPDGSGILNVFVLHTTAALTTADLDPGTDKDLLDFLYAVTPDNKWRHPHDPSHAPDHILASLIGSSLAVPYEDGALILGTWQRVVMIELDGPRERSIFISG